MMQHQGLPVAGYQPQSDAKVAVVNLNKELEERVLRQIDGMTADTAAGHDPRMIARARTGIQEAFMWLNRAVFQPARIGLPEDANGNAPAAAGAPAVDRPAEVDRQKHRCPRRYPGQESVSAYPQDDTWQLHGGVHTCSYCGSLNPDEFMVAVESGHALAATDKNYKVYIHLPQQGQQKFYFDHLSDEQRRQFFELLTAEKLTFSGGSGFYVLPFFITRAPG